MKDLFEYFRKREAQGKHILNDAGKKFFGEVHMIFNDGKPVHTREWQMNDVAMVVESKKV
jgi:hypothetical protein